jgi:hypothetical protein
MAECIQVLFIAGDHGVYAQCLDYDLAAQGATPDEAEEAFFRTVGLQIELDRRARREPFTGLGKAPERFWNIAETVSEWLPMRSPALSGIQLARFVVAHVDESPERSSMQRVGLKRR